MLRSNGEGADMATPKGKSMITRTRFKAGCVLLVSLAIAAVTVQEARALIFGGAGNDPLPDPGWPKGAAEIINNKGRIAYWVGPPLGGGQWHAEYRGDAKTLSTILAAFGKLEVKSKRVVLHDGVGFSFWLAPNNEPAKRAAAKMDWSFMVWQKANWDHLRNLPAHLNPITPKEAEDGPPAQLDVYTGGNVRWDDVMLPMGFTIIDQRLEAHGFTLADSVVLEGKVTDLASSKPVAAKVRLERIEPQKKGGYRYAKAAETSTDAAGHWVLKKVTEGWYQVVVEEDGILPRVAGSGRLDGQPRWHEYDCGLARPASVSGRITDDAGRPLAGVEVRIDDITTVTGAGYPSPRDTTLRTGADGRFRTDRLPVGKATIWLSKPGYCRPGLGQPITTPKNDIALTMMKAGRIRVTVDFAGKKRPAGYIVQLAPEGGERIGSYGGSGNINAQNQIAFDNVPPGRYVIQSQPNPGALNQQTEPRNIEVQGGQTTEVTLRAKN